MQKGHVLKNISEYLISQFQISPEKIKPKAYLFKNLEMDSIDALDWFAAMESEIGLPIFDV
jgi:acyl carrier protein